jgi:voltage-gated potassium channel
MKRSWDGASPFWGLLLKLSFFRFSEGSSSRPHHSRIHLFLRLFLLYFMDLLWPIDIVMNLITGFYVGGEVEHGHREIAKHYANTWLIPDLLAACPLVLASHSQEAFVVLSILKIPRLMQLPYRFFHLRSNIGSYSSGLPWLIVVGGFLGLHLISCGWRITLRADGDEPAHIHDDVFKKWMDDAYWTSMTLTSVGYGDVVPIGNVSKLYSILVMILGSTICGAFVGSFSFFLQKVVNNESEQRMAELSSFMRRRSVPKDLQRKVRHNLKQHLTEPAAMAPQLLVQLSPSMQRELCLAILNDTVLGFPLFRHAQRSFVAELAQAHCWEQILPGDIVADEGQSLQEVVFLIEGSLQAWVRPGFMELDAHISALFVSECSSSAECTVIRIKAGAWFGEASLFQDEHVYTASVSALTRCEVALLPSAKYIAILQRYPWLYERHQSLVKKIEEGTIKLLSLKYRDPEEARRSKTKNGGFKRNMTHYFGQRASAKPGKRSSNSS